MQNTLSPLLESYKSPANSDCGGVYWEPRVSILPNRLVTYQVYSGERRNKKPMPKLHTANGKISRKASSRLSQAVRLLYAASKRKKVFALNESKWYPFKLNFITLTLPSTQIHTDGEIHKAVFKPFIRYLRETKAGFMYVYKAEVQDNGNLHYHLTTNTYLHHKTLRNLWNKWLNKLGYIDRCKVPEPNSTDITAVKNDTKIEKYLIGYLSKKDIHTKLLARYLKRFKKKLSDQSRVVCDLPKNYFKNIKRRVTIKVWDASKCLLIGKLAVTVGDRETTQELCHAFTFSDDVLIDTYYQIARLNKKLWNECKLLKELWHEYVSGVRKKALMQEDVIYLSA